MDNTENSTATISRESQTEITVRFSEDKLHKLHRILTPFLEFFTGTLKFDYKEFEFVGTYKFLSKDITDIFFVLYTMEMGRD